MTVPDGGWQKVVLMTSRVGMISVIAVAAVVIAVGGGALLGRATVDLHSAHQKGYQAGLDEGYFKGLPVGEAQGRREGRALEEGIALPAADRKPVADAFNDGYAAGANDAFAGYDGGWAIGTPYVIVLQPSNANITYRIASRTPVKNGVSYYLCPDGKGLCQRPLH